MESPDILLSIGTGLSALHLGAGGDSPFVDVQSIEMPWYRVLFSVVRFQIKLNLDTEKRWHELQKSEPKLESRLFRINPWLGREPPEMDDKRCVSDLLEQVAKNLQHQPELQASVRRVACVLVASSFYFQLRNIESDRTSIPRYVGIIKCRLSENPDHVKGLAKFLDQCLPSFLIQNAPHHDDDQDIKISTQPLLEHGAFDALDVAIELYGEEVETTISLKLPGMTATGQLYPISGFPRCLYKKDRSDLSRYTSTHDSSSTVHSSLSDEIDRGFEDLKIRWS